VPNVVTVLRQEILRLARKESKQQLATSKSLVLQHRRQIAELRKQVADLTREVRRLARQDRRVPAAKAAAPGKPLRFSATRLRAQRIKLGVSAADFAKLVGASPQSVYNWETGVTRPRKEQIERIAAARGIGKREARERLGKKR